MSKFKSLSALAVLAILMLVFSGGCGGGSSSDDTTAEAPADDTPRWDTDPVHTTPAPNGHSTEPAPTVPDTPTTPDVPTVPDTPTTPTVPDTPDTPTVPDTPTTPDTPEQTPTNPDTYTDTYDIANVLNGNWYGVSGSGTAKGRSGTIIALMSSMSISIVATNVSGGTGTTYITARQYWNYTYQGYSYSYLLYCDAEPMPLTHVGSNTWRLETSVDSNSVAATIMLTSEREAIVTQNGTLDTDDGKYSYSARYTIRKSAYQRSTSL